MVAQAPSRGPLRRRLAVAGIAAALLATGCGGGTDAAPAERSVVTIAPSTNETIPSTSSTAPATTTTTTPTTPRSNRELIDDALDAFLAEPDVSYVSVNAYAGGTENAIVYVTEGDWSESSTTTEVRIAALFGSRSAYYTAQSIGDGAEAAIDLIEDGIAYRFVGDTVWIGTADGWVGAPVESDPEFGALREVNDAADLLSGVLAAYDGEYPEPAEMPDGTRRFRVDAPADVVVPLTSSLEDVDEIFNVGFDGQTGDDTMVVVVLDDRDRIVELFVEQSAWWGAAWRSAGLSGRFPSVTYRLLLEYPDAPIVHPAPCNNPVAFVDAGVEYLDCPVV